MSLDYNYRHLYYFWVVAKEGGITRAAARLGMAVQTVSAQVRELERSLGHALLRPAGRGVTLTEAGQAALRQAETIFQLGQQLPELVRAAATTPTQKLVVGISDGLPKLVVHGLLRVVLDQPALKLECHDGEFEPLLADLALHRLDLVLADRPAPTLPHLRLQDRVLVRAPLAWYAAPQWQAAAEGFPASLDRVPVLLPTGHAAVRPALERWFERLGLHPRVVGEFEDSALMSTFGAGGLGVFPAPRRIEAELGQRYGVRRVGDCSGVDETVHAVQAQRKLAHPLIARVLAGVHEGGTGTPPAAPSTTSSTTSSTPIPTAAAATVPRPAP